MLISSFLDVLEVESGERESKIPPKGLRSLRAWAQSMSKPLFFASTEIMSGLIKPTVTHFEVRPTSEDASVISRTEHIRVVSLSYLPMMMWSI